MISHYRQVKKQFFQVIRNPVYSPKVYQLSFYVNCHPILQ